VVSATSKKGPIALIPRSKSPQMGNNLPMSTATTSAPAQINRPNIVAVGTIVWLSSELMFFAALFAMYFTTRAVQGPEIWGESTALLDIPFASINTTILVLSSVTCQFGVFAAERFQAKRIGSLLQWSKWGMREWFALTFIMGAIFIGGQVFEYAKLSSEGLTLSSNAYGSVFYMTTGFHGLHVTGGLIAFLIVLVRVFRAKRFGHRQATTAIVVSYYWHFVDIVWIALFSAIYLVK
jgi:cytochrome c oxidase subunit III